MKFYFSSNYFLLRSLQTPTTQFSLFPFYFFLLVSNLLWRGSRNVSVLSTGLIRFSSGVSPSYSLFSWCDITKDTSTETDIIIWSLVGDSLRPCFTVVQPPSSWLLNDVVWQKNQWSIYTRLTVLFFVLNVDLYDVCHNNTDIQ